MKRRTVSTILLAMFLVPPALAQEPTARLAGKARLDLSADAAVGALKDGSVVKGDGTLSRMTWKPEAEQARGYTLHASVVHFGWIEGIVRFTPTGTGKVTL